MDPNLIIQKLQSLPPNTKLDPKLTLDEVDQKYEISDRKSKDKEIISTLSKILCSKCGQSNNFENKHKIWMFDISIENTSYFLYRRKNGNTICTICRNDDTSLKRVICGLCSTDESLVWYSVNQQTCCSDCAFIKTNNPEIHKDVEIETKEIEETLKWCEEKQKRYEETQERAKVQKSSTCIIC